MFRLNRAGGHDPAGMPKTGPGHRPGAATLATFLHY
jgi:hypothetical protein